MSKFFKITTIVLILFTSCIVQPELKAPELKVKPDTVQNVSIVSPGVFEINCFGNDLLKRLVVRTYPSFFVLDSSLPPLTHTLYHKLFLKIPQNIQDSMMYQEIKVDFELYDINTNVKQSRKIKIINPYKNLYTDSATLYFHKDSAFYYSFSLGRPLKHSDITNTNFDLVFIYHNQYFFTLCSPNSPIIRQVLYQFPLNYSETSKNITLLQRTNVKEAQISPSLVFSHVVKIEYINNDQSLGIGVGNLISIPNDVIAFKTVDNRKGFIVVKKIDFNKKSLTFKYYIQVDF